MLNVAPVNTHTAALAALVSKHRSAVLIVSLATEFRRSRGCRKWLTKRLRTVFSKQLMLGAWNDEEIIVATLENMIQECAGQGTKINTNEWTSNFLRVSFYDLPCRLLKQNRRNQKICSWSLLLVALTAAHAFALKIFATLLSGDGESGGSIDSR